MFPRGFADEVVIAMKVLSYQFDDCVVDLNRFRVFKAGEPVKLEPKAFEVLVYLLENSSRVVEKSELLDSVWKDSFVTENALTRVIAQVRKALGDTKKAKYVETVHKRGYRFILDVDVEYEALAPHASRVAAYAARTDLAPGTAATAAPAAALLRSPAHCR